MSLNKFFFASFVTLLFITGCGSTDSSTVNINLKLPNGATVTKISGSNVLPLTVNGSTCAANSYQNKPCITIKVCSPGDETHCDTITDVLVDTGSTGLRIFKSVLHTAVPTAILAGANPISECAQFGDHSGDWGPVMSADIVLGGEPAVTVPIQVIDSTAVGASNCSNPDTDPGEAGFNAILGVGLPNQDCGSQCVTATGGTYFACTGGNCSPTTVLLSKQVSNPIAFLPTDKNGIIMELPTVAFNGATSATGYLVLGIGTQSNNVPPSGIVTYPADPTQIEISTTFNGVTGSGIIDSGSNSNYFTAPAGLPNCDSDTYSVFYCPDNTTAYSATIAGVSGTPSNSYLFAVGNFLNLAQTANNVFIEIAGGQPPVGFDWGLPFYLGRNVYVGYENQSSSLGSGMFWALETPK